jgi:AraC-like DNA-binding protein
MDILEASASARKFDDWEMFHQAVADAYYPHTMRPISAGFARDSSVEIVDFGSCRVTHMALGATVALKSDHPGGYAINIPISGRIETKIGGTCVESSPGEATVCPPDTPTLIPAWAPECQLLGFRVERRFLDREFERVLARRPRTLLPHADLRSEDGRLWMSMLRSSFEQARCSRAEMLNDARLTAQIGSMLVTGLLLATTPDERNNHVGTRPRVVRRVIDAIQEDPARLWTPSDMAELAGVGVRRLQQAFREYVGQTPFQYLHDVRLARAHHDLVNANDDTSVTEVAMRWSLNHTGRFAADYRQRYGRAPSETLLS